MDKPAAQWMVEPLKKYATFSGRARRKEYWWFQLFMIRSDSCWRLPPMR
jgi:hypothetical protein